MRFSHILDILHVNRYIKLWKSFIISVKKKVKRVAERKKKKKRERERERERERAAVGNVRANCERGRAPVGDEC